MSIEYYEKSDFPYEKVVSLKQNRLLYVVFSTLGEREADLIYNKISLLKSELGDLVDKIFLSHRRAGDSLELTEQRAFEADPSVEIVICNDFEVPDMGKEKGKGADMRRTLYHINNKFMSGKSGEEIIIVFLDADVVAEYFGAYFVLSLSGAVLNGADFAKASFWREMGRVKKYVAQPLFSVIDHTSLNNLASLSYPLSGEVSGTMEFFNSVNFWQIYGVETGINVDSVMGNYKIADVNLGLYDHEHHGDFNIQKMSFGIIRTYFLQLLEYGIINLGENAKISDVFKASYIDDDGLRKKIEVDLSEKKYDPLKNLV